MKYPHFLFSSALLVPLFALTACSPSGTDKAPAAAPASLPASVAAPAATAADTASAATAAASAASVAAAAASEAQPASDGPVTRFHAYGFSPAWQADVDGNTLTFDVPETTGVDQPLRKIEVERLAFAKGVDYNGQDGKVEVIFTVKSGPCDRATDNDKPREFHATLQYGKQTYHGCADAVR